MKEKRKILVTGASGFIGGALFKDLISNGYDCKGLVRKMIHIPNGAFVQGDLLDHESLEKATQGIDLVIHAAAVVPNFGKEQRTWKTNVQGTKSLINACLKNGVSKFVFISSEASYKAPFPALVKEDWPFEGFDLYGRSKALGEKLTIEMLTGKMFWTILRPAQVYGPGDTSGFTARILNLMKAPLVPKPIGRKGKISLIFISDLVKGIKLAALTSKSNHRIYNLAGPKTYSLIDMRRAIGKSMFIPVPPFILQSLLSLRWLINAKDRPDFIPRFRTYSRGTLTGSLFLGGPNFSGEKAKMELGIQPSIDIKEGLSRCMS